MRPCFDISGPTLGIDVNHVAGYELFQQMLAGTIECTLPQLDDADLENSGFLYGKTLFTVKIHIHHCQTHDHLLALTNIPIRNHISGLKVLNRNQEGTQFMLTLLRVVGTSYYHSIFALNRCLYCE